jgi:hypothetical protein
MINAIDPDLLLEFHVGHEILEQNETLHEKIATKLRIVQLQLQQLKHALHRGAQTAMTHVLNGDWGEELQVPER